MNLLVDIKYHDFPTVCRICLKKDNLKDIFQCVTEGVKIVDIFQNVLNEQLIKDEKPQNICCSCVNQLLQLNAFIKLYHDSKNALQIALDLKDVENLKFSPRAIKIEAVDIKNEIKSNSNEEFQSICKFCNFHFTTDPFANNQRVDEETHIRSEHLLEISENGLKYCPKCKIAFETLDKIQKHFFSKDHQEKKCSKCEMDFNTIKECFAHVQTCKAKPAQLRENAFEVYTCIHCDQKIETFENVFEHYKNKHKLENTCLLCSKTCLQHMKLHLYSKHRPDRMKFLCLRCYIHFETKQQLLEHKSMVDHSVKTCEICNETYTGTRTNHERKKHFKDQSVCNLCGKTFKYSTNYLRHHQSVHLGQRFQCDKCPSSQLTAYDLKRHMEVAHNESFAKKDHNSLTKKKRKQIERYICPICSKKFANDHKKQIKLHQMMHERGDKLQCLVARCALTFPDNDSRLEHMSQSHKKFTCDECQKDYFTAKQFQRHCLIHTWLKEESTSSSSQNICYICRESFDNVKTLSDHTWTQHKVYLCPFEGCGEVFQHSGSFSKHKRTGVHGNNQFKYSCNVCKEEFKTDIQFAEHQKRHDDKSRKFKCNVCKLRFRTAAHLKVHSRRHTGEKPYACRFCSKTFTQNYALTVHERIHTGEKPFACTFCDKRFAYGFVLREHILKHEKLQNEANSSQTSAINM